MHWMYLNIVSGLVIMARSSTSSRIQFRSILIDIDRHIEFLWSAANAVLDIYILLLLLVVSSSSSCVTLSNDSCIHQQVNYHQRKGENWTIVKSISI